MIFNTGSLAPIWYLGCFALGMVSAMLWPGPPPFEWQWGDGGWAMVGLALFGLPAIRWGGYPGRLVSALIAGLCLSFASIAATRAHWPSPGGGEIPLQGVLMESPRRNGSAGMETWVLDIRDPPLRALARVWRPPMVQLGDRLRLSGRLEGPRGVLNPSGWDAERALFAKGITGEILSIKSIEKQYDKNNISIYTLEKIRTELARDILRAGGDGPGVALLPALVLGDPGGISSLNWELFRETGTLHLMVISGLHIGLVAATLATLVALLIRVAAPGALLQLAPARFWQLSVGLLGAAGYALLAGFGVPARRALALVFLVALGVALSRPGRASDRLLLVFVLVLLGDPLAALSSGFWLSFAAVACLGWMLAGRWNSAPARVWARLGMALKIQWSLLLAMLAPLALTLGQVAPVAPLANLFAVPLVAGLAVPAALAGTLLEAVAGLGDWLLWAAATLLEITGHWLTLCRQWLGARPLAQPPLGMGLSAFLGALVWLLPVGVPGRVAGAVLLLALLLPTQSHLASGNFDALLLDGAEGPRLVVTSANHRLLYDGGGREVADPGRIGADSPFFDLWLGPAPGLGPGAGLGPLDGPPQLDCTLQRWHWDGVAFELGPGCALEVVGGGHRLRVAGVRGRAAKYSPGLSRETLVRSPDLLVLPGVGAARSLDYLALAALRPGHLWLGGGPRNAAPAREFVERLGWFNIPWQSARRQGYLRAEFRADQLHPSYFSGRRERAALWRVPGS